MAYFLQNLIIALNDGSSYALIALGYTMVYGVLRLINFAHGDVFMIGAFVGAYTARFLNPPTAAIPSPEQTIFHAFLGIVVAMVVCGAVGFVIERLAYRPLRNSPKLSALITAIGVSLLIEYLAQMKWSIGGLSFFGPDPTSYQQIAGSGQSIAWFQNHLGISVVPKDLIVLLTTLVTLAGLYVLVRHTRIGKAMRAVSQNPDAARLMGVNVDNVISFTFVLGSMLAAIVLTLVPEALRSAVPKSIMDANTIEKWRMVIYSLFIILAMLFMPRGLFGRYEISDLYRWVVGRVRRKRPAVGSPVEASGALPPGVSTLAAEWGGQRAVATAGGGDASGVPLLDVQHLTMQFGGLRAVDDFGLTLLPGELVGLIGPNGAGKTTVFNVLTGVYRPTSGPIRACGASIAGQSPHAISRRGVARTFQNIRLFVNLSVLDNVQIAQHVHHRQGIVAAVVRSPWFYAEEERSRQHAMGYLDLFGLANLANEQARNLSYGDQRRLEIARALATRPKLLLLDEPAAGMNPTEKRELMEMIQSIRARFGLTILIIEHDMKVIMGICQRILVLDYGKTIAAGTPAEIRRNPAVIAAYLGASAKQG